MRGVHSKAATLISLLLLNAIFFVFQIDALRAEEAGDRPPQEKSDFLPKSYGDMPLPPKMIPRVQFWVNIYAKVNSWEMAIHDVRYPQLTYEVVDTKNKPKWFLGSEKKRISSIISRVASKKKGITEGKIAREKLSKDELRVFELFEANGLLDEIEPAANLERIRGQAGLKDALEDALFVSGRYLPRMELVFERFGLPTEIAYLPFVESGFNKRAVSKVGASGIWQFMPYTGKLFLRVDQEVDERNDPMRAAEAAARLMSLNFSQLEEWPLAITAYNHGTAGIANAVKTVGSKDLSEIIEKYVSRTFGFASQNFYASFLGALHVAKNSEKFLGSIPRARKLEFDEFIMPHFMEFKVFIEKMGIDESAFRELNPALTEEVYSGRKLIPVGYTVRVPIEDRMNFLSKYEAIPPSLKFREQKREEVPLPAAPAIISDRKTE